MAHSKHLVSTLFLLVALCLMLGISGQSCPSAYAAPASNETGQGGQGLTTTQPTLKYSTPIAPGEYFILVGKTNTQVLDIANGSKANGGNVQVWSSNNTKAQLWRVSYDQEGRYTFVNVGSGRALDVKSGTAKAGQNVQQWNNNGTLAQKWILSSTSTGIRIESALNRSFVLDCASGKTANKTNIRLWKSNNTVAQRFEFIDAHPQVEGGKVIPSGIYTIESKLAANKVLDVAGGSNASKANIQLYNANHSTAQRWSITYGADGFYTITSVESGQVLDVAKGIKTPAANVWQYRSNGTDAQKWALRENADGSYSFINKNSATMLSVAGAKTANGTNIQTARQGSSNAVKFKLNSVPILADGTYVLYSKLAPTSKALDIAAGSVAEGGKAQSYKFNDSPSQRFYFTHRGNNVYAIQAVVSGRYLSESNGKVVQRASSTGPLESSQLWRAEFRGGGLTLSNVASSKVLYFANNSAANGSSAQTRTYTGNGSEKFRAIKQARLIAQGLYTLENRAGNGLVLDVASGSWSNNANAQTYKNNGSNAQKFALIPDGDAWRIIMAVSGNALEAAANSANTNARLSTTASSQANKLWKLTLTEEGIVVTNKASGSVLGAAAASPTNGTNVAVAPGPGAANQAWKFEKTSLNLSDPATYKNIVKAAPNGKGRTPKLDANGYKYSVSSGAYKQLISALSAAWNRGRTVNFFLMEADTGITYTLNADSSLFGASTKKAALVTYIFQELIEKKKVSYSSVYSLMYNTVVHSDNGTYATLYNRYAGSGYRKWLNTQGVGWMADSMYSTYTPRAFALMWTKIMAYEESGGAYVSKWRSMFNKSDYSFIRMALSGSNTVYSKPGWMFGGSYGTIHDDGAIIKDKNGRTWLLTVMTTCEPDSQRWISINVVKALNRIHQEMPAT